MTGVSPYRPRIIPFPSHRRLRTQEERYIMFLTCKFNHNNKNHSSIVFFCFSTDRAKPVLVSVLLVKERGNNKNHLRLLKLQQTNMSAGVLNIKSS